jgi:hypothetical protein
MADVTITAADVRPLPGCIIRRFTAGGTIDVGSPVYVNDNDEVSAADGSAVDTAACIGVLVAVGGASPASREEAASGDPVDVVLFGPVAGYSTNMAAGTYFYVDDDAGVIADAAGTKSCIVGVGLSGSVLLVRPQVVDLS